MKENIKLYIEKTDNSKFVAAVFENYGSLINYQVKMVTNNKIRYLLPSTIQQTDDKVIMYYDITNKISLSEYAKRNRFNNKQFLSFLNTLVKIDDEIDEFQLINSGLIFMPDWVFVDLNGFNAEYIYIPNAAEPTDAGEIRLFLSDILRSGCIDASAQELVGGLFMLLQNSDLSVRDIKDLIYRFEEKEKRFNFNAKNNINEESPEQNLQNSSAIEKNIPFKPSIGSMLPKKKPDMKEKKASASKKDKIKEKPNISAGENENKTEAEKSTLPRTLAIMGNVLVLALIYKIYTMGILSTEAGPDFTKIGVLIGAVAVIDVIVIKELIFSGKKGSEKPNKEKTKKVKVKKEKVKKAKKTKDVKIPAADKKRPEMPGFDIKPEMPSAETNSRENEERLHSMAAVLPQINKKPEPPAFNKKEAFSQPKQAAPEKTLTDINKNFVSEKTLLMPEEVKDGIENDETILMTDNEPRGYIERYEGDKPVDKYVIKKDNVIIGRLRSQVDMTVLNPRVGKIHAEIIHKNGEFYIKDLSSKNGTYLGSNAERIKTETEYKLNDGEKFRLADSSFIICFIK